MSVLSHTSDSRRVMENARESLVFPFIAIQVRRGDYENFCRETRYSSGRYKYRIPPYVHLFQNHPNVSALYHSFMDVCYPSLRLIVDGIASTLRKLGAAEGRDIATGSIQHVFLATNAPKFRLELKRALKSNSETKDLTLLWFESDGVPMSADHYYTPHLVSTEAPDAPLFSGNRNEAEGAMRDTKPAPATPPPFWHRPFYTSTEAALMDINFMSMASVAIVNRYSTFGQTAIDEHIVREHGLKQQLVFW